MCPTDTQKSSAKPIRYVTLSLAVLAVTAVVPLCAQGQSTDAYSILTFAGSGEQGFTEDGTPASEARFNNPWSAAAGLDPHIIYIVDKDNNRIRRIDRDGAVSTFAGNGAATFAGDVGAARDASLNKPKAVVAAQDGSILIADTDNHCIRRVDENGIITTFAGIGGVGGIGDEGVPAAQALFRHPSDLAIDVSGNVYVVDSANNRVRMIDTTGIVRTIIGGSNFGFEGDGGPAIDAALLGPSGIDIDKDGNIYVVDQLNHVVRKVDTDGIIRTVAGTGRLPGDSGDGGEAIAARLSFPRDVLVDDQGNLIITDERNHRIRRVDQDGIIDTIAGVGIPGYEGDGGPARLAFLDRPAGLMRYSEDSFLVADSQNHVVRDVTLRDLSVTPTPLPTATPTPTPTATSTPTPRPTNTPTSTPTQLPVNHLAPSYPKPGDETGIYYTNTNRVEIPVDPSKGGVLIVLSSTPDGAEDLTIDDTISLDVSRPDGTIANATITFSEDSPTRPPENVTAHFQEGSHNVTIRLLNLTGDTRNPGTEVWVAVLLAPEISDIPDLRLVPGRQLSEAFDLDDYVVDRDSGQEGITWDYSVTGSVVGLEIDRKNNVVSLEAAATPTEGSIIFSATDGVFSTTDEVHVKTSTFLISPFIRDHAPLVKDFAFITPYSLYDHMLPEGVYAADVPFSTTFEAGMGLDAANVARGQVYLFSTFPGGLVDKPIPVSVRAYRQNNPTDRDGAVIYVSSCVPPTYGNVENDYNFSTNSLNDTSWFQGTPPGFQQGTVGIDRIPLSTLPQATDGHGLAFTVEPGQAALLLTPYIDTGRGTVTMQGYFAAENEISSRDLPNISIGLFADSSNVSINTIVHDEILGGARYQLLATTYDTDSDILQGVIQVLGTHTTGTVRVYVDNVRVYHSVRKTDRVLGKTRVSTAPFDGSFETVRSGLGELVELNMVNTWGGEAVVTSAHNHFLTAGGLNQSLILDLSDPLGAVRVDIGPLPLSELTLPKTITAECYVKAVKTGEGFFALGLSNGLHTAITYMSNDSFPRDGSWIKVSVTGDFRTRGTIDPMLILQNAALPGAIPGLVRDAATVAIDDITVRCVQDPPWFWSKKLLRLDDD